MELKQVLHYYLGQKCMEAVVVPGQALYFEESLIGYRSVYNLANDLSVVRPILRPLSDMTEEEMRDFVKGYVDEDEQYEIHSLSTDGESIEFYCGTTSEWQPDGVAVPVERKWVMPLFQLMPHEFHFLLQRGFDLFGLIESGQAVDAKSLQ